jgi:hypothetical protein
MVPSKVTRADRAAIAPDLLENLALDLLHAAEGLPRGLAIVMRSTEIFPKKTWWWQSMLPHRCAHDYTVTLNPIAVAVPIVRMARNKVAFVTGWFLVLANGGLRIRICGTGQTPATCRPTASGAADDKRLGTVRIAEAGTPGWVNGTPIRQPRIYDHPPGEKQGDRF